MTAHISVTSAGTGARRWVEARARAGAAAQGLARALREPPGPPPGDTGPAPSPSSRRWWDQSLSRGAAGVGILHAACTRDSPAGESVVDRWLRQAVREDISAAPGAGLWFGAPAVAFAVRLAAPERGAAALRMLDAAVDTLVRHRLDAAHERLERAERPRRREYDLVAGLSGLGAYLLIRDEHDPLLREVLGYLVRLTQTVPDAPDGLGAAVPGWWTLDDPGLTRDHGRLYAAGHADLGMAHGIAGPLALLALAARAGVRVDGHDLAIDRISAWLASWAQPGPAGPWWPARVSAGELRLGAARGVNLAAGPGPSRPSWCYGTPGIARAQQLAALALDNPTRRHAAETTLLACLRDPAQLRLLRDPGLCHGWAGVLATTYYAARDTSDDDVRDQLRQRLTELVPAVITATEPLPATPPAASPSGLIDGPAGAALVLHTLAADPTAAAGVPWARCLLLR